MTPSTRAPAEGAAYDPTPEDLAELGEHYARLAEVLDECPCCGNLVRVGDDSERMGDRYICRACARWLDEQEVGS